MSRTSQTGCTADENRTQGEIKRRIREAAETLHRMPGCIGPREYGSNWPPVVRESWDALWEMDALMRWQRRHVKCPPAPPTAREIAEMDEALEWMGLICGETTRRVVWARACGVRWDDMSEKFGSTRQWLYLLECAGLRAIAEHLNGYVAARAEFST